MGYHQHAMLVRTWAADPLITPIVTSGIIVMFGMGLCRFSLFGSCFSVMQFKDWLAD